MIWYEAVLIELWLVLGNDPRLDPGAYEARSRAFVEHAVDFVKEHILSPLTPLRLAHLVSMVNSSIFLPVYVKYQLLWIGSKRFLDGLAEECVESVPQIIKIGWVGELVSWSRFVRMEVDFSKLVLQRI